MDDARYALKYRLVGKHLADISFYEYYGLCLLQAEYHSKQGLDGNGIDVSGIEYGTSSASSGKHSGQRERSAGINLFKRWNWVWQQ